MFLLLRNTGDLAYFGLEWVFDKNAAGAYLSTASDSCIAYTLFTARVKELDSTFICIYRLKIIRRQNESCRGISSLFLYLPDSKTFLWFTKFKINMEIRANHIVVTCLSEVNDFVYAFKIKLSV